MRSIYLPDAEATFRLGCSIGACIHDGLVMAVTGDLGAGKTTLAQGIARGLGVPADHYVNSPTFAIMLTHPGRIDFHHIDLYRLGDMDEAYAIGLDQIVGSEGVTYVEWPGRLPELIPPCHLSIELSYEGAGRQVVLKAQGDEDAFLTHMRALLNAL